jgi:MFS transporter, ACS family, glucarate transporter
MTTRARFIVLRLTFVLSVITYLDRVAISSAAPAIRQDLQLDLIQMGWVFSVFTFAYAAFEIPSGWLGDVIGPRKVLARIVLWWSAFTMLTGAAWSFASLVAARFLFGVGEAGAFPNISRALANWFPTTERGSAHGVVFLGTRLGGALAPPLVALLMSAIGWRATFVIFGALGALWCISWLRWFEDDPATHPAVSATELATIQRERSSAGDVATAGPQPALRELLSPNLFLICGMYFCMSYGLYFNLTWLPTYLRDVRGFTVAEASWIAGLVLMTGGTANWLGGRLTDRLVLRYGLKIGRSVGALTMPLAGLALVAAALVESRAAGATLLALALGLADLSMTSCWAMCHDVGHERAGTVTGAMNTVGNLGGAISPLVVGYSVQWWSSWTIPVFIAAGVYVLGGVATLLVDPRTPLWRTPSSPVAPSVTVAR